MGCLRNIIRAVIITLAIIGFLSIGGKELVQGWLSQWLKPSAETIVERAKKVGDFSQINEEFEIEKDLDEDLGIVFSSAVFDGVKRCQNHCLFCFVDQQPKGLRKTLYVKDDVLYYIILYALFCFQ